MIRISVLGAGAFGTALAIALSRSGAEVTLIARDPSVASTRQVRKLPDVVIPDSVSVSADLADLQGSDAVLLATPMQALSEALARAVPHLGDAPLVACCKGVDLTTLQGPTALTKAARPGGTHAVLTGPSFAADIARGLPTALTLACADDTQGGILQAMLSTPTLRLYRTTDVTGAELGGALKNVIAIACGATIGLGLGDSARAALLTRGFAEMQRLAARLGARTETLMGLSGLGDLVLTCTSELSRNYRFGLALGRNEAFDQDVTVEGSATARAVTRLATELEVELPISAAVARLVDGDHSVAEALHALLNRPLKEE